jgi:transposase InsO family protein
MKQRLKITQKQILSYLPESISIPKDTYLYYKRQFIKNEDSDKQIKSDILEIWNKDNHYGIIRVTDALNNDYGYHVNHKKVRRLMRELGIYGLGYSKRIRRYDSSKGPNGKRVKNYLNRRFESALRFQKLVSDVTEFKLPNGDKLYLEPIMDLYNREILDYELFQVPNLENSLKVFKRLVPTITGNSYKTTIHTDQGWQYRHYSYQSLMKKNHIRISMSKVSTPVDNAPIESFFNKLKVEIKPLKQIKDINELKTEIDNFIDYYNNVRIQHKLKGRSPVNYRLAA